MTDIDNTLIAAILVSGILGLIFLVTWLCIKRVSDCFLHRLFLGGRGSRREFNHVAWDWYRTVRSLCNCSTTIYGISWRELSRIYYFLELFGVMRILLRCLVILAFLHLLHLGTFQVASRAIIEIP